LTPAVMASLPEWRTPHVPLHGTGYRWQGQQRTREGEASANGRSGRASCRPSQPISRRKSRQSSSLMLGAPMGAPTLSDVVSSHLGMVWGVRKVRARPARAKKWGPLFQGLGPTVVPPAAISDHVILSAEHVGHWCRPKVPRIATRESGVALHIGAYDG